VERQIRIILVHGCRSWRQAISSKDSALVPSECKTYTIGSRLRTWNGRAGLYLYIGVDPGGKLFRVRILYHPTCVQDLHNGSPLVNRSGMSETREEGSRNNQVDCELEHDEGREMKQLR